MINCAKHETLCAMHSADSDVGTYYLKLLAWSMYVDLISARIIGIYFVYYNNIPTVVYTIILSCILGILPRIDVT